MKTLNLLTLNLIFTVLSTLAFARGGEIGNGTDNFRIEDGSAWFLDESRSIKYCLDVAPDFGLTESTAANEVNAAFSTWDQYFTDKKINQQVLTIPTIAHKTSALTICDGSEDLKFYLGSEDTQVAELKSKYENPTGFAERQTYDKKAGWGKGLIWIAKHGAVDRDFPNWSENRLLRAILLHEIGHVMGVGHIAGTIMAENLSQQLDHDDLNSAERRSNIDGRRELKFCHDCAIRYDGVIGYGTQSDQEERVFMEIFNRAPKGKITARITGSSLIAGLTLNIADDASSKNLFIKIEPQDQTPGFETATPVFKIVTDQLYTSQQSDARVVFGTLDGLKTKRTLVIEINSSSEGSLGPILIKQIKDGGAHIIFRSVVKN